MSVKILFAPKQPPAVLDIARSLVPPGYELVVADVGTPEFIEAAADAEFYLGLARRMGGEFFRSAPKLRLVQLLSAGYDHVDVEAARKAGVPVLAWGNFVTVAVNFVILAFVIFLMVRQVNKLRRAEAPAAAAEPAPPPEDIQLLREIRDSLRKA